MLKIGLTGSIAVGKSFVCKVFRELGCHVLDADITAREVVAAGTPGFSEVVEYFGAEVIGGDGELDRSKLGAIVFADREKLDVLNSIIHPKVFEAQEKWLELQESKDPDGVSIVDAALMIESGGYKRFDELIVVWCEPAIQLKRLMLRDGLSREEAEARISAQMPQETKKTYAQHLIDTSKGFEDTRRQAVEIYERLTLWK